MKFDKLNINDNILKAINELGFEEATKVQELSIPRVLDDKDLIVMAKTGSGKTAAFSIPIIEKITDEKKAQALIVTPTRELAVQVEKDVRALSKHMPIKTTTVYGGHNMASEIKDLKAGAKIIAGTPGRIIHHIKERNLKTSGIRYLVLDEADRMLDMGFIDQMYQIIKALPKERITLLFSATMPDAIQKICQSYMNEPETIAIDSDTKTVDTITQTYIRVEPNEKRTQLDRILAAEHPKSCMIFCNMRVEVDRVQNFLARRGYVSEAIHGANTQSRRMRTIDEFKQGDIQILVATDVAARGIHIDDMEMVINYDVPGDKDNYIHRIGRTGRAGNGGKALNIVTSNDIYAMYEIEEHAGARIDEASLPSDEAVEEGRKLIDEIWKDKRQSRKTQIEKKIEKRKPRQGKDDRRPKKSHGKTQNKPHNKGRQQRREHPKMHRDPIKKKAEDRYVKQVEEKVVRRVIEENFVPIPKKVEEKPKKKRFSLRNLFKK